MSSSTFLTEACSAIVGLGKSISLHYDGTNNPPVATASNEISGSPYARQTTTWGAPVAGTGSATSTGSTVQFGVAASTSVNCYGVWDSSGNFLWGAPLSPGVTFNANGSGEVNVAPSYTFNQS
ncbi:hypothetical protein E2F47_01970 [Mycobacterium eburneum]|nr:hypothetical protein [Mycobacterium eburneum]TDH57559.1 hypothetical protein E2F47_01970 [Mycobacterium eburneum]